MKLNSNTILMVVATLILLGGGYWYLSFAKTGNDPSLTADVTVNSAQVEFQTFANQIQPIKFETAIFSNARFMSLIDIATPVTSEPAGRLDPFAPVAGVTD